MTEWQERLIAEKYTLGVKIEALQKFIESEPAVSIANKILLENQLTHMKHYFDLLVCRLELNGCVV